MFESQVPPPGDPGAPGAHGEAAGAVEEAAPNWTLAMAVATRPGPVAMTLLEQVDPSALGEDEATDLLVCWERSSRWVAAQHAAAVVAVAGFATEQDPFDADRDLVRMALAGCGGSARKEVGLARDLAGPLRAAGTALGRGEISWEHAKVICRETELLDGATRTEVADAVVEAMLARVDRPTPGELRRRVRRAVILADPLGAELRAEAATARRCVQRWIDPDAQARLAVAGPAAAVAAIWTAMDLRAAHPAAADERSLDQRRFDALVDICVEATFGPEDENDPVPTAPADTAEPAAEPPAQPAAEPADVAEPAAAAGPAAPEPVAAGATACAGGPVADEPAAGPAAGPADVAEPAAAAGPSAAGPVAAPAGGPVADEPAAEPADVAEPVAAAAPEPVAAGAAAAAGGPRADEPADPAAAVMSAANSVAEQPSAGAVGEPVGDEPAAAEPADAALAALAALAAGPAAGPAAGAAGEPGAGTVAGDGAAGAGTGAAFGIPGAAARLAERAEEKSAAAGRAGRQGTAGRAAKPRSGRRGVPGCVYLYADAATWAGLADDPVELAGYGPIPAGQARRFFATATWRAVVADALTGATRAVSDKGYVPTAHTLRHLHVQDRGCLFPGCPAAIWYCDTDHNQPWEKDGPTDTHNCGLLCRRHHLLKTFHGWRWKRLPDNGGVEWTDPRGRSWYRPPNRYLLPAARAGDIEPDPDPDPGHGPDGQHAAGPRRDADRRSTEDTARADGAECWARAVRGPEPPPPPPEPAPSTYPEEPHF